ncbi:MAG: glycosyltransferase [Chloroflexi bacterium]|nr:glycosyltransferase [Chloroflexota bacterium]
MSVFLRSVETALARTGVKVDVYAASHGPCPAPTGAETLSLTHVATEDAPEFADDLLAAVEASGMRYALVHSHYWTSIEPGLRLAERLGVPHVFTGHTLAAIKEHAGGAPEPDTRKRTEAAALSLSHAVVTFTEEESALLHDLLGLTPHKAYAVPMGVDAALFRPQPRVEARAALGIGPHERVVLSVGRIEPYKGTDVLVRALALLRDPRDVRLLVVGGNEGEPGVDWLRETARLSGVSGLLDWRRAVLQHELPPYYAAADVCAVPSLHETFGLAALEAMACGTPVVASDAGGLRGLVRHGETGLLCSPGDAAALAEAFDAVLGDPSYARRMGEAGLARAEPFTWESSAARLAAVYEQVASGYLSGSSYQNERQSSTKPRFS